MCRIVGGSIPGSDYLSAAKKRNGDLKVLRSVSRAYRASQVRHLKAQAMAIRLQMQKDRHDYEIAARAQDRIESIAAIQARYNQGAQ